MRALVITGAGSARVEEVEAPVPGTGEVVVDVRRAGICGTDVELFNGQLAYFAQGKIGFPIRPGHEWCGVVSALGDGVDPGWLGARVTGDTMLGCGHCPRCACWPEPRTSRCPKRNRSSRARRSRRGNLGVCARL